MLTSSFRSTLLLQDCYRNFSSHNRMCFIFFISILLLCAFRFLALKVKKQAGILQTKDMARQSEVWPIPFQVEKKHLIHTAENNVNILLALAIDANKATLLSLLFPFKEFQHFPPIILALNCFCLCYRAWCSWNVNFRLLRVICFQTKYIMTNIFKSKYNGLWRRQGRWAT